MNTVLDPNQIQKKIKSSNRDIQRDNIYEFIDKPENQEKFVTEALKGNYSYSIRNEELKSITPFDNAIPNYKGFSVCADSTHINIIWNKHNPCSNFKNASLNDRLFMIAERAQKKIARREEKIIKRIFKLLASKIMKNIVNFNNSIVNECKNGSESLSYSITFDEMKEIIKEDEFKEKIFPNISNKLHDNPLLIKLESYFYSIIDISKYTDRVTFTITWDLVNIRRSLQLC